MILVECGARVLVACIEKNLANVAVAERGSQMKVGIREAFEGGVGIMEEGWMGSENAADEQGVIGMDSTPQADGCVNPRGEEKAHMVSVERTGSTRARARARARSASAFQLTYCKMVMVCLVSARRGAPALDVEDNENERNERLLGVRKLGMEVGRWKMEGGRWKVRKWKVEAWQARTTQ
jgi:hypothetical protein